MINCYDKDGVFIIPPAKNNTRVGEQLSISAKSVNANHVIPLAPIINTKDLIQFGLKSMSLQYMLMM